MARPTKQGIEYFSFDVSFFSDIKIKKIIRACGPKGIAVLVNLLCNIYRDKGYYMQWDDEIGFLVADEVGANESTADEVVQKAIQVGFFDKNIYEKHQVLTSKGIQDRYLKVTYQRKNNQIRPEFYLETCDSTNKSHEKLSYSCEKHMNNSVNHAESTQSKVKESKEKESKENNYVFGVFDFLEKNHFGNPYSEPMATDISEWVKTLRDKGLSDQEIDEWMILGAKKAAGNNKRFWNYVNGTLRNWDNVGVYTEKEIENQKKDKSNYQKNKGQSPNYGKTLYTYYEQEMRFNPNLTLDEYTAKKRLNERDRAALEQYIKIMEENV